MRVEGLSEAVAGAVDAARKLCALWREDADADTTGAAEVLRDQIAALECLCAAVDLLALVVAGQRRQIEAKPKRRPYVDRLARIRSDEAGASNGTGEAEG